MPKARTPVAAPREVAGPRSLMRLLGLFDALAKSPKDGLGLAELNAVLKSPKSSLLNLLRPLVSTGHLNFEAGKYRLGPSIFRLAGTIMSVWNFSNVVRPFLEELALRSHESVYLGVLDRAGKVITYVDAIDSPHSVRYSVPVGAVRPLYATAAGRVLLAFADKEWQDMYISTTKLQARTPRTIATQKALREELERIRKTSYFSEYRRDVSGFRGYFRAGLRRRRQHCRRDGRGRPGGASAAPPSRTEAHHRRYCRARLRAYSHGR